MDFCKKTLPKPSALVGNGPPPRAHDSPALTPGCTNQSCSSLSLSLSPRTRTSACSPCLLLLLLLATAHTYAWCRLPNHPQSTHPSSASCCPRRSRSLLFRSLGRPPSIQPCPHVTRWATVGCRRGPSHARDRPWARSYQHYCRSTAAAWGCHCSIDVAPSAARPNSLRAPCTGPWGPEEAQKRLAGRTAARPLSPGCCGGVYSARPTSTRWVRCATCDTATTRACMQNAIGDIQRLRASKYSTCNVACGANLAHCTAVSLPCLPSTQEIPVHTKLMHTTGRRKVSGQRSRTAKATGSCAGGFSAGVVPTPSRSADAGGANGATRSELRLQSGPSQSPLGTDSGTPVPRRACGTGTQQRHIRKPRTLRTRSGQGGRGAEDLGQRQEAPQERRASRAGTHHNGRSASQRGHTYWYSLEGNHQQPPPRA